MNTINGNARLVLVRLRTLLAKGYNLLSLCLFVLKYRIYLFTFCLRLSTTGDERL